MRQVLLFLLLLAGNVAFAQDYAPLPDTGIRRYFTNSAGYLRGIRVDSVVQEAGYKRYVTFRTARGWKPGTGNNALADSNGACWLGKNVRAYANGDWHFPNVSGDTVLVKTSAKVGDSWVFHRDTSAIWTEAKVLSVDTQTIFGVLDSVKRIRLAVKNGNTALANNPISAFEILLSKVHGFAQVPDLYLYPYKDLDSSYNVRDYWYRKIQRGGGNLDVSNLLFRHVSDWNAAERVMYDLQVGDITYKGHFTGFIYVDDRMLDTVISRQDYPNYTDYTFKRWSWRKNPNPPFRVISVQSGLTGIRVTDKLTVDTLIMPEEYTRRGNDLTYINMYDSSFCIRSMRIDQVKKVNPSLYVGGLQYPASYSYKLGLGVVYYEQRDGDGNINRDDLYGYLKNGVSCGSIPIIPSSVENISLKSTAFKIYPHPATTEVFLQSPQLPYPATIRIHNLQGQLLSTQKISTAGKPISTINLPEGLYLLSVTDAGGSSAVQKLIIVP